MPTFNVHYTRTLIYAGVAEIEAETAEAARAAFDEEVESLDEGWTGEAENHGATIIAVEPATPTEDDDVQWHEPGPVFPEFPKGEFPPC